MYIFNWQFLGKLHTRQHLGEVRLLKQVWKKKINGFEFCFGAPASVTSCSTMKKKPKYNKSGSGLQYFKLFTKINVHFCKVAEISLNQEIRTRRTGRFKQCYAGSSLGRFVFLWWEETHCPPATLRWNRPGDERQLCHSSCFFLQRIFIIRPLILFHDVRSLT